MSEITRVAPELAVPFKYRVLLRSWQSRLEAPPGCTQGAWEPCDIGPLPSAVGPSLVMLESSETSTTVSGPRNANVGTPSWLHRGPWGTEPGRQEEEGRV